MGARAIISSLFLSLFLSFAAEAATLNLDPGESAVINPNVSTAVTCGIGTPVADCSRLIAALKSRYETCKNGSMAATCFNSEWSTFKQRHPACVTEAFDMCNKICLEGAMASTCYNACR